MFQKLDIIIFYLGIFFLSKELSEIILRIILNMPKQKKN